jgi:hypothetical protein
MTYVCWCKWTVKTKKQFENHLKMHVEHGDYDIPDFVNGTDRPHPWTFSSTKILVIARDMGICRCCGRKTDNYEVHHIKPRCEGGSDHPANLVLLDEDCHQITISASNSYGGVPRFCILPHRKSLPENQMTIGAYV